MNRKNIVTATLVSLLFVSCEKILEEVSFDVIPDKVSCAVGEPVTFHFEGNPNFVTFFSGEEGKKYEHRNRTEIDPSEIESSTLTFKVKMEYGTEATQPDPLRAYISKDFQGLVVNANKPEIDLERINQLQKTATDITTESTLIPASLGKDIEIKPVSIIDYTSNFSLAFHYVGLTGATQRKFTLSGMSVKNKLKSGAVINVANAEILNFIAYDVVPSNSAENPYYANGGDGSWNLKDLAKNSILFQGGGATAKANDDWLISTPMKLNACVPDRGEVVKDINRTVKSYSHVFEKPGTYRVVFYAGNINFVGEETAIREVTIEVKPDSNN